MARQLRTRYHFRISTFRNLFNALRCCGPDATSIESSRGSHFARRCVGWRCTGRRAARGKSAGGSEHTEHDAALGGRHLTIRPAREALREERGGWGVDLQLESNADEPGYNGGHDSFTVGVHRQFDDGKAILRYRAGERDDSVTEEGSLYLKGTAGEREWDGLFVYADTGFSTVRGSLRGAHVDVSAGFKHIPTGEESVRKFYGGVGIHTENDGIWAGTSTSGTYNLVGVLNEELAGRGIGMLGFGKIDLGEDEGFAFVQVGYGRTNEETFSTDTAYGTSLVLSDATVHPLVSPNLGSYLSTGDVSGQVGFRSTRDGRYVEAQVGTNLFTGERLSVGVGGGYLAVLDGEGSSSPVGEALVQLKNVSGGSVNVTLRYDDGKGMATALYTLDLLPKSGY